MEGKYFDVAFLDYEQVIANTDLIVDLISAALCAVPNAVKKELGEGVERIIEITVEGKTIVLGETFKALIKNHFGKNKDEYMAEYIIELEKYLETEFDIETANESVKKEILEMIEYKRNYPIAEDKIGKTSVAIDILSELAVLAILSNPAGATMFAIYEAIALAWSIKNVMDAHRNKEENRVIASSGDDELLGGHEDDKLYGGHGSDVINGYSGDDYIRGGLTVDANPILTLHPETSNAHNTMNGGSGSDTIIGEGSRGSTDIIFGDNEITNADEYGKEGYYTPDQYNSEQYEELNAEVFNAGGIPVRTADTINGGGGKDIIFGNEGNDVISTESRPIESNLYGGVSGKSYVYGGAGEDVITGGNDKDHIFGGDDKDIVNGGYGADKIYGERGDDELHGGDDEDIIVGGAGTDTIHGDDDDDHLYGDFIGEERKGVDGDAKDFIYGDKGEDTIFGGGGDDELHGGNDNDVIVGGTGGDEIHGDDDDDYLYGDFKERKEEGNTIGGSDKLHGGDGEDHLYGGSGTDHLYGGEYRDILHGDYEKDTTEGETDYLYGEGGNDDLHGGGGDYTLCGGDGLDNILGDGGNDTIYGDDDNTGNPIGDSNSGEYKDTIKGGLGEDTIYGGSGGDIIYGDHSDSDTVGDNDIIIVGFGGDEIHGGGGDDKLYGGAKDATDAAKIPDKFDRDFIYGGSGADYIDGGEGDDYLYGNTWGIYDDSGARDELYGGNGFDRYFVSRNDIIVDDDGKGNVTVNGHLLKGASRERGEGEDFIDSAGYKYRIINDNTIEVIIPNNGGTVIITGNGESQLKSGENYQEVYNQLDIRLVETWKEGGDGDGGIGDVPPVVISPIILNLDGDISNDTVALTDSSAYFDMKDWGVANNTGWVGKSDGLLVHDKDSNGQIDNINELFGNKSYKNGFEQLRAEFDSNKDEAINNNDENFNSLQVWVDGNGDGIAQNGELHSLSELDIASINLKHTVVGGSQGGDIIAFGSYTKQDGTSGEASDYLFDVSMRDSISRDEYEVTEEIKALFPNLNGFGSFKDIHTAMALDASFYNFIKDKMTDLGSMSENFDEFMMKWSGLEEKHRELGINTNGEFRFIDMVWILSRMTGSTTVTDQELITGKVAQCYKIPENTAIYNDLKERFLAIMNIVTNFEGVEYNDKYDRIVITDISGFVNSVLSRSVTDPIVIKMFKTPQCLI